MGQYLGRDIESIQKSIVAHVEYTLAMTRFNFSNFVSPNMFIRNLGMPTSSCLLFERPHDRMF
jgi:hypothetical protein